MEDWMEDTGCGTRGRVFRCPVPRLGLRCSVFGPRRQSGTGYPVPGVGCLVPANDPIALRPDGR